MSGPGWLRPADLDEAIDGWVDGRTLVGGGAALASHAFPVSITGPTVDLSSLGLDHLDPPRVGAMVTLQRLLESDELREGWPAIAQAVRMIATPEVRRLATVGGAVGARLPTSDLLLALCAYGSSVTIAGAGGRRDELDLHDALTRPAAGIIVEVTLGARGPGAYRRFAARPGFAPAVAAVAGVRRPGGISLWAGAVSSAPIALDPHALPEEGALLTDERASAWYRRTLLEVLRTEVLDELDQEEVHSPCPV